MSAHRLARRAAPAILAAALLLAGCRPDRLNSPESGSARSQAGLAILADSIRVLAAARNVGVLPTPAPVRPALARLGQALAFDKILSGNRDISCMTCHLPDRATGDARSLSIGQGASGTAQHRVHPQGRFIPRNAPPLYNLTALQSFFWDGRVSRDSLGHYHTPAREQLTPDMARVFEFGALSAQPLFPVLNRDEMRAYSGNELAAISDERSDSVWAAVMRRLGAIPQYVKMFEAAYPGTKFQDMNFAYASNAIAGFFVDQFTFNHSPWDLFLAGDDHALTPDQMEGAANFLTLKCSICHNGPAFTDNKFHNVAIAQFGPGEGNGLSGLDDFGRERVVADPVMRYAFRTTPLRNVMLTAPYGHDGAFMTVRDFIAHYSQSDVKLQNFDPTTLEPLLQGTMLPTASEILQTRDTIINGVVLPDSIVDHLATFMTALTDDPRHYPSPVPATVPSGLPVDRP